MLDVIREPGRAVDLLDFGCGLAGLLDVLVAEGPGTVTYAGLDVSDWFIAACRMRHPGVPFYLMDVLSDDMSTLPDFDYVVMNGIFTYRGTRSESEMVTYLQTLIALMFAKARIGLAFNVMSKHVDWERDELFHMPMDPLLTFLARTVTRHMVVRHDYGWFEYTVYLYREPSDSSRAKFPMLVSHSTTAG